MLGNLAALTLEAAATRVTDILVDVWPYYFVSIEVLSGADSSVGVVGFEELPTERRRDVRARSSQ